MKTIPLTQGKFAIVDDEDYEKLSKHKWFAQKCSNIYYAMRNLPKQKGKRPKAIMHREILGLPKDIDTDHRNSCGLDNRKANLRPATPSQNCWNQRPSKNGSSVFKGVSWHKGSICKGRRYDGKWQAYIKKNRKLISLGRFDDEIEAAKAYDQKAKELFGEFALLNFSRKHVARYEMEGAR